MYYLHTLYNSYSYLMEITVCTKLHAPILWITPVQQSVYAHDKELTFKIKASFKENKDEIQGTILRAKKGIHKKARLKFYIWIKPNTVKTHTHRLYVFCIE